MADNAIPRNDAIYRDCLNTYVRRCSYTFTLSPAKPEKYTDEWYWNIMGPIRTMLEMCSKWILVPEFSDEGRLHWHGCIKFKNASLYANWYICFRNIIRRYGSLSIQKIKGIKWIDYIFADYDETLKNPLFKDINIIEYSDRPMHYHLFDEDAHAMDKDPEKYMRDDNNWLYACAAAKPVILDTKKIQYELDRSKVNRNLDDNMP